MCLTARIETLRAVAIALLTVSGVSTVLGNDGADFKVIDARTRLVNQVYELDANIRMALAPRAAEALLNGVPLEIVVQILVVRERKWLWDETTSDARMRFHLTYHALSERYVVKDLATATSYSYPSLDEALFELGTIRKMPILAQHQILDEARYRVRLRAELETEALPTPVRLWAYVSRQWRLSSDSYSWPLRP